jgi:hypothetical protein
VAVMRPKQAIDSAIQSTLAHMMESAIAEIDANLGKQVEVVGNISWPISTKTLPIIASVAKQSISAQDGPPTSSQSRSCSKRIKDPLRGGRGVAQSAGGRQRNRGLLGFARNGWQSPMVSSIVVGRRLNRHSPDERRLRSEARRLSLVIAMASSRPEVDVEIAEAPVYRVCLDGARLGPCGHYRWPNGY